MTWYAASDDIMIEEQLIVWLEKYDDLICNIWRHISDDITRNNDDYFCNISNYTILNIWCHARYTKSVDNLQDLMTLYDAERIWLHYTHLMTWYATSDDIPRKLQTSWCSFCNHSVISTSVSLFDRWKLNSRLFWSVQ